MQHTRKRALLGLVLIAMLALAACNGQTATPTEEGAPVSEAPTQQPVQPVASADMPVQIAGEIEVSNALIVEVYFNQRFVYLQDLTGFMARDFEYEQPLEGQILGPVLVDEEAGTFSYLINLPVEPPTARHDFDGDGDAGLAVWQLVMDANLIDDPFFGANETGGWSTVYTSAHIDSENEDEIDGGKLLIWAPDAEQEFPTGFGDDGLLFTEDDPHGPVPAGYSVVDLDAAPFTFTQEPRPVINLMEGDIQVTDLSSMGWTEAFDALFAKASVEYPFTEEKGIDWDALYEGIHARIQAAEADNDALAYYLALRDFSWAIPDGHVGLGGNDFGLFQQDIGGSYGFAIEELSDGRVIASIVLDNGAAAQAGMQWGAEIMEWDGKPISEAIDLVVPWSSPFSNPEALRAQQLRYLVRDPIGTEAEITFQNPGGTPQTVTLAAVDDGGETFNRTSVFAGFDDNALPLEYEILDSGYGYIKFNSLSDDLFLTLRLWEIAIQVFIDNQVPGVIIDMRQNLGGAPIGSALAGYFYDGERFDISRSYYYSEKTGQLETFRPPDYIEPDDSLYYDGRLAVLVSTACSSACEDVAWALSLLPQTQVIGYSSTNGIFGEVGRGQYTLPGGGPGETYSFQIPTGLTTDMDGNIIIEGPGVVPDVRVPVTEESLRAQVLDGRDVVLDFAIDTLDQPEGVGVVPSGPPTLTADFDVIEELNAGVPFFEDIARESYSDEELAQAGTFSYTVAINRSRNMLGGYLWCSTDADILEDNWSKFEITFTLDGQTLDPTTFNQQRVRSGVGPCYTLLSLFSDWPPGDHLFVAEVNYTQALNDGIADYPAGVRRFEYRVIVAR